MKLVTVHILNMTLIIISFTLLSEGAFVVDFVVLNLSTLSLNFNFYAEKQSIMFVFTVLTIFSMVFLYSFSYLSTEVYLQRFLWILTLFASSMCILILSGNLFSSLIGWDGLGVTSLFLILFYYSKSALKASTLTFLMNRVGDCFFILSLTQVILLGESQISNSCSSFSSEITILLILTSITKSAQMPFSTWLPAAMEAPTPVSALVHSSTLVTAGIYLLFRYKVLWMNSNLKNILMVLSLATCFMAALSALVESDLKKLIALSTLSQLGFIMFSFSLGLLVQGYMHMLMHAFFKALLFMCAGYIIHAFKGSQSINILNLSKTQSPVIMMMISCSLMSMSGLPYLSGFYSKDLIIDSLKASSWPVSVYYLLIISFLCTIVYSTRVVWYLLNSSSSYHSMSDSEVGMIKSMFLPATLACVGGSAVTWLMVESEAYIESSKILVYFLLSSVVSVYWCMSEVKFWYFLESKWGLNTFNPLVSNLFFHSVMKYKLSSDLLGVPEMISKNFKSLLWVTSKSMSHTMIHYSGNLEFFVFLTMILMLAF